MIAFLEWVSIVCTWGVVIILSLALVLDDELSRVWVMAATLLVAWHVREGVRLLGEKIVFGRISQ